MGEAVSGGIDSLLVANRGEIACRIIRTARAEGVRTIAVYSEADANAPHVRLADEAVQIGPAAAAESYLYIERIIEAARTTRAAAIHPGYGFLSENADFATACAEAGILFVGPPAEAIELMGNKAQAKRRMISAGVPCVPGYEGEDQSDGAFTAAAERIGYPVMVKAAAGGGGRGMRLVNDAADMPETLKQARSEAENAFGSGELILEKAIVEPRHVEFQIFADSHGNVVHLGERDCSVQRRHQKVIEEAPSPAVDADLRDKMGAAAVEAARSIGYVGAGTVEFLLDRGGDFYFLEMNTRLQVEHPVTEMITGLDLVSLQLAVANGAKLPFSQNDVRFAGHAIEARLYAENPAQGFLPATGQIELWLPPDGDGVRVDGGIATGQMVSPFYDPMLAKIIAWGKNRDEARQRLIGALGRTALFGLATNRDFLIAALRRKCFADGEATTAFIAKEFGGGAGMPAATGTESAMAAVLRFLWQRNKALARAGRVSHSLLNWSSGRPVASHFSFRTGANQFELSIRANGDNYIVATGGEEIAVITDKISDGSARLRIGPETFDICYLIEDDRVLVATTSKQLEFVILEAGTGNEDATGSGGRVVAPMHGRMAEIFVTVGEKVAAGDRIAVLEAMKMQHQISAPTSGRIAAVHAQIGSQIGAGDPIIEIEIATDVNEQSRDAATSH